MRAPREDPREAATPGRGLTDLERTTRYALRLTRVARFTRPFMRHKTPVLYRLCQALVRWVCPPGKASARCQLVTAYDGGLFNVDTSSSTEYHLLFRGAHEPHVTELLQRLARPGDTCLDIGANVGSLTLVLARAVGPTGRVLAFEPHPQVAERLRRNVELNCYRQVTVVEAAVSDTDGTATLYGHEPDAFRKGLSSLRPDEAVSQPLEVATVAARECESRFELTACHLIKIDVEGHEPVVLKGLDGLIEKHRPHVIFELRTRHWSKFGEGTAPVLDRFRALDYDLYFIRRGIMQPLAEVVPDSCEMVCVPRDRGSAR